ncbi:MAG: beta-galactosidase [Tannerella sp.]|jgi:hypothetical protein|nr:beta-galactosidase [Tannerella sp.]
MKYQLRMVPIAVAGMLFFLSTFQANAQEASPFGICAHLQSGEEHQQMPRNLRMISEAGIRWLRVDFSWAGIESPQGNWQYEHIDRVVRETEENGLHILPLLLYNVDWANPAWQHLDAWLVYVEKTVSRYKDKFRYWEIWNEPNLFWEHPNGANYKILLEATYRKIKEIDPGIQVVYGGTSGIPSEFFEASFKAGAGAFFDVLNVHPYRGRMTSVGLAAGYLEDLENLRKLMTKYHIADKKIWVTEMGWSTWTPLNLSNRAEFHEKITGRNPEKHWKVGVMYDKNYPVKRRLSKDEISALLTDKYTIEWLRIPDLKTKDLKQYDALFFPPWEIYPVARLWDELLPAFNYGLRGGKMFFYGDVEVTEENQAEGLPQSILLSLRFGIERYFWYEFQAPEYNSFDREDRFGIVHRNLEPKPAYFAYATLCKLYPEGSKVDMSVEWNRKNCCIVSWTQPSGVRVWAIWSPGGTQRVPVKIGKGLQQVYDYTGKALPAAETAKTLSVGPGVTYLVGPQTLE